MPFRRQYTHPLLPPGGRAARLTHGIRQGHVAGPLLSQGLMHSESCWDAPVPEAASSTPGSGRSAEHPTLPLPLPVPQRAERDCLCLRAATEVPPPAPFPSSPSLRSWRTQHWRSVQLRAPAQDPPFFLPPLPPHPSYPPPSLPSQTVSCVSPLEPGLRTKRGRLHPVADPPTL